MLFRKDMDPRCAYCQRGSELDEDRVLCPKKGVVSPGDYCRSFQYDPLRRKPPEMAQLDFSKLSQEDFTL